ncbi:MAG TPA: hypothetical protein VGV15_24205 [Terriglobales bacterium]|nr:hypothetical protein [Terriglobales bacterium]
MCFDFAFTLLFNARPRSLDAALYFRPSNELTTLLLGRLHGSPVPPNRIRWKSVARCLACSAGVAGDQIERWVGSGLLVAERQFRKFQGYREIPSLFASLATAVSKTIDEVEVA